VSRVVDAEHQAQAGQTVTVAVAFSKRLKKATKETPEDTPAFSYGVGRDVSEATEDAASSALLKLSVF
jgi:hypothetical protein